MTTNQKRVLEHATAVLGDEVTAKDWIEKASATLGAAPIDLVETEEGLRKVMLHLNSISRHRHD